MGRPSGKQGHCFGYVAIRQRTLAVLRFSLPLASLLSLMLRSLTLFHNVSCSSLTHVFHLVAEFFGTDFRHRFIPSCDTNMLLPFKVSMAALLGDY